MILPYLQQNSKGQTTETMLQHDPKKIPLIIYLNKVKKTTLAKNEKIIHNFERKGVTRNSFL
jgi:hypothetical protein